MKARVISVGLVAALLSACASFSPPKAVERSFLKRAESQTSAMGSVSAVVLSDAEAREVFGSKLGDIQPVWIAIENHRDEELLVMLVAVDPDYYSPSEAAWRSRQPFERRSRERMEFFSAKHLPLFVPARGRVDGYVFTNRDPGLKAFTVQLIGDRESRSFSFEQLVPGLRTDLTERSESGEHGPQPDLSPEELRAWLEELPGEVFGPDGKTPGDPLNIVIVGDGRTALSTFARRGWDPTETLRFGTAFRTVMSSLLGSAYRTSPVSPLTLFGRRHDHALQKIRRNVDERNHLRLWRAPAVCDGQPVWVGQISRDIGVKPSTRTFVTHRIDPEVDEARDFLMQDLISSGSVRAVAYVAGVAPSRRDAPRKNYTHDPFVTDGLRIVLFLTDSPTPIDEIDWLDWEWPTSASPQG